ncbi:F0F1 ATP synthase subunit A [candidate division KSB1 bacterium]|nr:F0F1 ATP synthase subunit A [candidate division KSB1 bacterium]
MNISPDSIVILTIGPFTLNGTIFFTWIVMALITGVSWMITRKLSVEPDISRWQNLLESIVSILRNQIRDITRQDPDHYLEFVGTLFLFISISNLMAFIPGYQPPTGSIYTTAGLALSVFFAVPYFGIRKRGLTDYLKHYIKPVIFMLPFNIIGELSRTLAMAVRLFGNIMSGTMIVAILLSIAPLFVPIVMELLGLLIGQIQAYIFAVLATVYIASATRAYQSKENNVEEE